MPSRDAAVIKRTIEISSEAAHLAVRHGQLLLQRDGQIVGQVPCEDLGVVIVDHPAATYSHQALASLIQHNAALVVCGSDHLPCGVLLPIGDHTQVVTRLNLQINATLPLKKKLWQQIVRAKVRAQGDNLRVLSATWRLLRHLERQVKSGDSTNVEAHAAKAYWKAWLTEAEGSEQVDFRRLRDGAAPNGLLNYGYAVMRAAVARAIVGAGLHPAAGLHHTNRSNAFCLADDLLEPLRPIVDARVRELYFSGLTEVDRETKQALLETLVVPVRCDGEIGPVVVAVHRYVASLVKCLAREANRLQIPVLAEVPEPLCATDSHAARDDDAQCEPEQCI